MQKRVGIINGGGDCPGLNTVIDSVVRVLYPDYEVLGFMRGFEGLLRKQYISLTPRYTGQYKFEGGTFLKTVNKGSFAAKTGGGDENVIDENIINETVKHYEGFELEGLICLGGDGSMSAAQQLIDRGLNIVGVPKSIDNDLTGTDFTFGFQTAVEIATEALDRLNTTAYSHDRVMILEVMGRNAGWIGLYSGIAGGANVILIPELEFDIEMVKQHIKDRTLQGQKSALIVVSEGAIPKNGEVVTKNSGHASEILLGGISHQIEAALNEDPEIESRATILGHIQRGGSPCGFDRLLSRSLGSHAAHLFMQKNFGQLVTYKAGQIGSCSIKDAIAQIKRIENDSSLIKMAKGMGISFGDEPVKLFEALEKNHR
jgi:6-phosphofructokinase 1